MKKNFVILSILSALLLITSACQNKDAIGNKKEDFPLLTTVDIQATKKRETVYNLGDLISEQYPQDDGYYSNTDCAYYLTATGYGHELAETPDGYYFFANMFLMYCDAEIMTPIPVCAKPECSHNEEKETSKRCECNAFFFNDNGNSSVFYIDGQLYVLYRDIILGHQYTLAKVNPDGSERKNLFNIQQSGTRGQIGRNLIHRGRFYCVLQQYDTAGNATAQLWSYSLTEPTEKPVCVYQTASINDNRNQITQLFAFGKHLYVGVRSDFDSELLLVLDLNSGEWFQLPGIENHRVNVSLIHDDSLLTIHDNLDAAIADQILMKNRLDGQEPHEIMRQPFGFTCSSGGYLYTSDPLIDGEFYQDKMYIYDTDYNLVDTIAYETFLRTDIEPSFCCMYPLRDGRMMFRVFHRGGEMTLYYFECSEVGSNNIQVHEFFRYHLLACTDKYNDSV